VLELLPFTGPSGVLLPGIHWLSGSLSGSGAARKQMNHFAVVSRVAHFPTSAISALPAGSWKNYEDAAASSKSGPANSYEERRSLTNLSHSPADRAANEAD